MIVFTYFNLHPMNPNWTSNPLMYTCLYTTYTRRIVAIINKIGLLLTASNCNIAMKKIKKSIFTGSGATSPLVSPIVDAIFLN